MNVTDEEWRDVINITYEVVVEQKSRSRAFDRTLSKTLKIGGLYEVIILQSETNVYFNDMLLS